MDKTVDMAKTSATGSLQLFLGKIISTFLLGIGTIIVGAYIQEQELGLFTVALIPATTLLLFQDLGVGLAVTKYCAEYISLKKVEKLRGLIKLALSFNVVTGIVLTLFSFASANFIAPSIFSKPEASLLIIVASFTIFFTALISSSQSIFFGFERMNLATYTMISQAMVQAILSPLLVILGYGAMGAMLGYTLSVVVGGSFAVVLLYFKIFVKLPYSPSVKIKKFEVLKTLLSFGLPLAISTILVGVLNNFYSFMMASAVAAAMIGNYRIASYFGSFLEFFTYPLYTTLFPAFSKVDPQKEPEILETVFSSSVKYVAFFLLPATMAMIVLSGPLIGTLYGDKWLSASLFLAFYGLNNLFSIFGNISVNSFLKGVGETKFLLKQNILTLLVGIPLAFLLIPPLGIIGVILGPIIAGKPSLFWGLYHIWKNYEIKVDLMSSVKLFVLSTISAVITYFFINYLYVADLIKLILGITVFLLIYLITAPIVGAITQKDIKNLKFMLSELGLVSRLLNIPLVLLERIANYFHSEKK